MASGPGTPIPQSPFVTALEDFKKKLKKEGIRNHIHATTLGELEDEIDKLQTQQHSRRTMQNFQRLRGFLEATNQFGKVIEVFCQVHEIVAFIWGPLKFLLQVADAYTEAIHELIGLYQELGQTMSLLQQSWEIHPKDANLATALVEVYKCILEFHLKALEYFKRPAWKQVFVATWKTYRSKFGDVIEAMKDHRSIIVGNTSLAEYRQNREDREKRSIERRGERNEQQFKDLRTWLQGADVDNDHYSLRSSQIKGTGRWLFGNEKFKKWFDPISTYSLLWMNGMPGAGKSVLAAMVLDEIRANKWNLKPKPKTIYFYCKEGDKERNNFVAIGRSLLLQLLTNDSQLVDHLYSVYRDSKDTVLRTKHVIEELLEAALLDCSSVYVVLDGIDECLQEERQGIVHWFKKLVEKLPPSSAHQLRVLLVSQSDMRERRDFAGITSLKIQPDDNKGDVAIFASEQAANLQLKFSLTNAVKDGIARRIPDTSGGIFLLAKLTCGNLLSQATREDLDAELEPNVFPRDIDHAYERIMVRIMKYSESENIKTYCLMLFGWLVCAKRPLRWYEIQCAKAIDPDNQKVDLNRKRFLITAKELCGSLIEDHHDGTIQFVHMTARWYLTESKHINLHEENIKLTQLCIDYLNFPALHLQSEPLDEYIRDGYYSFMDYAVSNWILHFEAATKSNESEDTSVALSEISESLDEFLEHHWANPTKPAPVAERHIAKLKIFQSETCYEKLVPAFGWMRKMVYSHTSVVSSEIVLDLLTMVAGVRMQIERIWVDSQKDADARKRMEDMYGKSIYKCPRLSCLHFSNGFENKTLRDEHLNKHERPHRCTIVGCPNSTLGFSKAKDLQKHMEQTHDSLGDGNNQFPWPGEERRKVPPKPQAPDSTGQGAADEATMGNAPPSIIPPHSDRTSTHLHPASQVVEGIENPIIPTPDSPDEPSAYLEEEGVAPSPKTPESDILLERPVKRQKLGPRTFECTTCWKTFTKKFNYESHMRRHSQEKPFACRHCQRPFARESDCKRHEKGHDEAAFRCGGCGKEFSRSDTIQSHFRSQVGSRCWEVMMGSGNQYLLPDVLSNSDMQQTSAEVPTFTIHR